MTLAMTGPASWPAVGTGGGEAEAEEQGRIRLREGQEQGRIRLIAGLRTGFYQARRS